MNIFLDYFWQFISECSYFWDILNSATFSIIVQIISLFILFKIVFNLTQKLFNQSAFYKKRYQTIFFLIPIIAIMIENFAWIFKFVFPKTIPTRTIICIAWIFSCFKFHSFALFLERITEKNITHKFYHKVFFCIEGILSSCFIINYLSKVFYGEYFYLHYYLYYSTLIFQFICIVPIISIIVLKLSNNDIPAVLKKQLQVFFNYLIIPYIFCLMLEFLPNAIFLQTIGQINAFANLGIIFIALAFYFFYKEVIRFRFLNLCDHVQIKNDVNISFTANFKEISEQLNFASNYQELQFVTKNFFNTHFNINKNNIVLYFKNIDDNGLDAIQEKIEHFFNNESLPFNPIQTAQNHKIFIGHEIDFDDFCTDNKIVYELSCFLNSIYCDIFLPILNNKQLVGYVVVKKDKNQTIYNLEQQNKMIVFAQFLAPAIYMLSQKNIYKLMQDAKEVKEELYAKHQEINQYKESIKKLLKDRIENHIGIIFYKQKHFAFRNKEAQQLIGVNPNVSQNHPTTATLINIAQQVEKFKTSQTLCITIHNGTKLIVTAMPYTEPSGGVVLTVRQPEATDIIKFQLDALTDPSKRDYLLYLETTDAGKLINKLLPGSHESLLPIKIELLHAALQKNALLLQSHPDDIVDIATIIHKISFKESMHVLDLQGTQSDQCAIKLFGMNPLFQTSNELAILEKFDQGTLLIKNIEYLDIISQQKLAYFIRYGIFTPLKSEQRKCSDIRIICSTCCDLAELLCSGKIIPELHKEFQKCSLSLPSLLNLNKEDLSDLIDGFIHQALQQQNGQQELAPLSIKDKDLLFQKRIESISEFKKKIHSLMIVKSQENQISKEIMQSAKSIDTFSCQELQLAAQLGKDALKDSKLMSILWDKLGSQTKIAELLGVNRSSVNRRCKDYNLI